MPGAALAQASFPNKPIKIVVGFAAGGPSDLIARVVGAKTGEILGAQVVIENKTGAGGVDRDRNRGAFRARRLHAAQRAALRRGQRNRLSKGTRYTIGKDFIAVGPQAETANILVVHPSLGVKSVADLVALAKAKPGDVQYATAGRGTATHLNSELFDMVAGIKTTPVHYRGRRRHREGPAVRPGEDDVLPHRAGAGVREGRQADRACDHRAQARSGVPRSADDRGVGLSRLRRAALDRSDGAGRHASRRHQACWTTRTARRWKLPEVKKALAAQGFAPI